MLVLKRHYQFWFAILGLHKLGAIAIPATNLLQEHDFDYRFNAAGVSAIVCTADGGRRPIRWSWRQQNCPTLKTKIARGRPAGGLARLRRGVRALFTRSSVRRTEDSPMRRRPDADVLHLRHHRLSQDRRPQLQVSPGPLSSPPNIGTASTRTGCTSPSPTPAGARPCGASSTASGCARAAVFTYDFDRFDAARHPAPVRQVSTSPPSARRPPCTACMIKEDLSQVRPELHPACHHRRRGPEPGGVPPVLEGRPACTSWRASARPRPPLPSATWWA